MAKTNGRHNSKLSVHTNIKATQDTLAKFNALCTLNNLRQPEMFEKMVAEASRAVAGSWLLKQYQNAINALTNH
jgi:hypothetical protein